MALSGPSEEEILEALKLLAGLGEGGLQTVLDRLEAGAELQPVIDQAAQLEPILAEAQALAAPTVVSAPTVFPPTVLAIIEHVGVTDSIEVELTTGEIVTGDAIKAAIATIVAAVLIVGMGPLILLSGQSLTELAADGGARIIEALIAYVVKQARKAD